MKCISGEGDMLKEGELKEAGGQARVQRNREKNFTLILKICAIYFELESRSLKKKGVLLRQKDTDRLRQIWGNLGKGKCFSPFAKTSSPRSDWRSVS